MVKRKSTKKPILKKEQDAWHLKVAFALGRTAKKVALKKGGAKKSSRKSGRKKASSKSPALHQAESFKDPAHEALSPILKELKAVADISGLTAAVEEMNAIGLKHSKHPVVNRLVLKINQLSPAEQEMLSRKFIERLQTVAQLNNPMYTVPSQNKMGEEECQRISKAFIGCLTQTLEDVGMTSEERDFLEKFSDDVTKPLHDLVQFYLHPKTFSQKVKRLWRIQRILIKMIKLIHMSNKLAKANAMNLNNASFVQGVPASNYWESGNTQPLIVKEGDWKIK